MRDNHNGLIELIGVSNANNIYSCIICLEINGEHLKLRFSIESIDYISLLKIMQFKPFENTGFAPYRYFFHLSYRKRENNMATTSIWVEQQRVHKTFEFNITQKLITNLLWFNSLTDSESIKELIV